MYLVEITKLGRNDASVSAEMSCVDYESLYEMVYPHLVSSDISFSINHGIGYVYAGFRSVGRIEVTAKEKPTDCNQ